MADNLDKQMVDWHSGFYAAAKFEFRDEPFEFAREFPLNQMPILRGGNPKCVKH